MTESLREPQGVRRNIAEQQKQNIGKYGIRALCVTRDIWESFKVDEDKLAFFRLGIKYVDKSVTVKPTDSYDTVVKALASQCTCGKRNVDILNGVDIETLANVNVYTQCPLLKLTCIRKVISQYSLPDPMLANALYDYYMENFHDKFIQAADKYLYLTPAAVFDCLKSFKKQMEMLGYYDKEKEVFLNQIKNVYKQHNKIELQEIGDKVRQICDPCTADKLITMFFEKALTCMMYDVFGMRYGVGLATDEKAFEIGKVLGGKWLVTLDISGFDNSHNDYIKQPWNKMISTVMEKFENRYASFIDKNVVIQQFCKNNSLVRYTLKINKKETPYCTLDLGPRLASGSTYTTLLNTFLMVLCIDYAGHLLKDESCTSSTSGDDALALFSDKLKEVEVTDSLYSVFGSKVTDFFNNLGIKLKYCLISKEPSDIVPCSLDTFKCDYCGVKMVRHFFKYIKNTFITEKYMTHFQPYGIPIEWFEQIVYEGEMAWGRGLKFVEAVMSPLNHHIDIRSIAAQIMNKLEKKIMKNKKITGCNLDKVERINNLLDDNDGNAAEIAKNLMAVMTETNYIKEVKNHYCPQCTIYYDKFLKEKYDIDADCCVAFFEDPEVRYDLIEGELKPRSGAFIPRIILDRAKRFYEERQANINRVIDKSDLGKLFKENLELYWQERIEKIDDKYFGNIKPKNIEGRIKYLTKQYMEIVKGDGDYFINLLNKQALLHMYYDVEEKEKLIKPVLKKEVYTKNNTYQMFKVRKNVYKLIPPKFTLDKRHVLKKEKVKNFENVRKNFNNLYGELNNEQARASQFIEDIILQREAFCRGKWITNQDLPPLSFVSTEDLIENRKELLHATRFYQETGKIEYKRLVDKYKEQKDRILSEKV
jgi:hypothetical protein